MNGDQLAALLTGLAIGVPSMPEASCRGNGELFDPAGEGESRGDVAYRLGAALGVCHSCPCLAQCRTWLAGLPEDSRPSGVVAGQLVSIGLRGPMPAWSRSA